MTTSQKSKRVSIAYVAAMTLFCGVAATSLSSQSGVQVGSALANDVTQQSSPRSDAGEGIGSVAASRKVQCIMPAAWRKNCGE
jgi:hypothetical protein